MPLDEFGKLVGKIASVAKDAISKDKAQSQKGKPKAMKPT